AGQAALAIQNARLYESVKNAYDQLSAANEQIIRSEKMATRGEIASEVSHELNNILSVVLLQCHDLQRHLKKVSNPDAENSLKTLTQSLRKITKFAESLLVGTGNKSEVKPVNFNAFVSDFVAFISVLGRFKQAKIRSVLDQEIGEILIDADQIHQVLLNIVTNAVDAKNTANIEFKTEFDFVRNIARLYIADDGPGIDPSIREKLFAERVTTKENGHGFGLPLCRKIVRNHNGDIFFESEPGKGTRFVITLPLPS
ncbi:MAG TPA: ATP-binding protein, partial [Bacteroidota bacterium]|nr:ATP-binding protein [Bacteroidota bacterium]